MSGRSTSAAPPAAPASNWLAASPTWTGGLLGPLHRRGPDPGKTGTASATRCRWKGIWWNIARRASPRHELGREQSERVHFSQGMPATSNPGTATTTWCSPPTSSTGCGSPPASCGTLPSACSGGLLVLTSPYTWLTDYTPKANWLGGIRETARPSAPIRRCNGCWRRSSREHMPRGTSPSSSARPPASTSTRWPSSPSGANADDAANEKRPMASLFFIRPAPPEPGAGPPARGSGGPARRTPSAGSGGRSSGQHHDPRRWRRGEHDVGHGHPVGQALLEPQKTMVISSALLKPRRRLIQTFHPSTSASSTQLSSTMLARSYQPTWCQIPAPPPR